MAKIKKSGSKRKIAERVESNDTPKKEDAPQPKPAAPEKPKMPPRIKEKNPGFGPIKILLGVILVLLIVPGIIRVVGDKDAINEASRGDKVAEETCKKDQECTVGTFCRAYKDDAKRCRPWCSDDKKCDPGFTCTSVSKKKARGNKQSVKKLCVKDDLL